VFDDRVDASKSASIVVKDGDAGTKVATFRTEVQQKKDAGPPPPIAPPPLTPTPGLRCLQGRLLPHRDRHEQGRR
jgi:hypothetical protein